MTGPILVAGFYGHGNIGDEAILSVLLEDLRAEYPDARIVVVTGNPGQVAADHGVETFDQTDVAGLIRLASTARLMVLGGGGLLQDYGGADRSHLLLPTQDSIGYYAGFAILGGLVDTPVVMYGIGVGPLQTEQGRELTALAAEACSAIAVRDEGSRSLLTEIGIDPEQITLSADAAFALDAPASITPEGEGPVIGVALRPWGDSAWTAEVAEALDRVAAERDTEIRFLPMQHSPRDHENDIGIARRVVDMMDGPHRPPEELSSPEEALRAVAGCDLIVAMRYHSVVFAALAGKPVVALGYDPKVEHLMGELGQSRFSLDLDDLQGLSDFIREVLGDATVAAGTAGRASELRSRATLNRQALRIDSGSAFTSRSAVTAELLASRAALKLEAGRLQWEVDNRQTQIDELVRVVEEVRSAHQQLAADHDALLNSKAMAPARLYWRLRELLGGRRET